MSKVAPRPRLTRPKLQRIQRVTQELIAAIHDARENEEGCHAVRPGRLCGLSRFLKDMLALQDPADWAQLEGQLKRRVLRVRHRLWGLPGCDLAQEYLLSMELPERYDWELNRFEVASRELLRVLSDVNITDRHEVQRSVAELLG